MGAARAPALKSNASSLASAYEPTPVILKLVPKTACIVAKLIIFFSMYVVCSITVSPKSLVTSSDFVFCSINKTPSFLPTFPEVAF